MTKKQTTNKHCPKCGFPIGEKYILGYQYENINNAFVVPCPHCGAFLDARIRHEPIYELSYGKGNR